MTDNTATMFYVNKQGPDCPPSLLGIGVLSRHITLVALHLSEEDTLANHEAENSHKFANVQSRIPSYRTLPPVRAPSRGLPQRQNFNFYSREGLSPGSQSIAFLIPGDLRVM